jgi:hypothetical protein
MAGFPVLDVEPDAASVTHRLRKALICLGVVVVLALVAGGVFNLVGNKNGSKTTSILGYQNEVLSQFAPDGGKPVSFASLGLVSGAPTASADGKLLLSGSGQLVTMDGAKPVEIEKTLYKALTNGDDIAYGFADGDAYVPIFDATTTGDVTLASTKDGNSHSLGTGVEAVGDPIAAAAYVTTPDGPEVGTGFDGYQPAASVEHRGIGIPTKVVAASTDIKKRLNIAAGTKIDLGVAPDPTGKTLAIVVVAHNGAQESTALVVYSSGGAYVGGLPSIANADVFWSSSGTSLFYEAAGMTKLAEWAPGSSPTQQIPLPAGTKSVLGCVWSPDGKQAMCSGVTTANQVGNWVLLDPGAGTATTIVQPSQPVEWLTGAAKGGS